MQKMSSSLLESITDVAIGLLISVFIYHVIGVKIMNLPITPEQNMVLTLVFTGTSFVRRFVTRRIFTRFK